MPDDKKPNDFRPKAGGKGKAPRVHAFVKPDLDVHVDEQEVQKSDGTILVCRCDKVCTCNTVNTGGQRCRCDTVSKCTCEAVSACTCNTVMVCSCDTVKVCSCNPVCGCDRHSPGGGGTRVCRCVPVRAH
jgi:hypothetical protein